MDEKRRAMNRRRFVACFSAGGLGVDALARRARGRGSAETITTEMVQAAQSIAGLSFTRAEQQTIVQRLNGERSPRSGFDLTDEGDGASTRSHVGSRSVHRKLSSLDQSHWASRAQFAKRLFSRLADGTTSDRQALWRAGNPAARARVSGKHRPSHATSTALAFNAGR